MAAASRKRPPEAAFREPAVGEIAFAEHRVGEIAMGEVATGKAAVFQNHMLERSFGKLLAGCGNAPDQTVEHVALFTAAFGNEFAQAFTDGEAAAD